MFSFFKSKKSSPPSSPEEPPIQGPDGDFVVVDPSKNRAPYQPYPPPPSALYPNFDQNFGLSGPSALPTVNPVNQTRDNSGHPVHFLHGVPFKLSTELSTGDSSEIAKIQIDDILAIITSKLEVSQTEYDFGLERSIVTQEMNDC